MSLAKAVGFEAQPLPVSWTQRDLLLYAHTIGAQPAELNLTYELDPKWSPFPTYPLVLSLKGDSHTVTDFAKMLDHGGRVPLPEFDRRRVVHAEQSIEVLRPIPASSGTGWHITKRVNGIKDTGKGIIMEQEHTLVCPAGVPHVRMFATSMFLGATFEKGFSKFLVAKPVGGNPPQRNPDYIHTDVVGANHAALYRLNGDYNPLHIDPKLGKSMGFGGIILHGLCSYGYAAHAIVAGFAGSDPSRFVSMSARFASPVIPGQTLETLAWKEDKGDTVVVTFVQRIKETGKVNLANGVVVLKKAAASKL
ncbi:HotDog domain-containing protein [Entophlyctis helioformis]|nr:HotDog domain-containing protein [Entophlyctis helioformis]